jgi:benzoate-CoA ligase family protein
MNLASFFLDRNLDEGRAEATALLCGDVAVSYGQLSRLTNQVGHVLRELGVGRGMRVLLALGDSVEFVATWYAAQKIGAVTAEVYTFLRPADYAYYLDYTRAAVVVVDATTVEAVRAVAGHGVRVLVVGEVPLRDGEYAFAPLVAQAETHLEPAAVAADDVAIWKFTTGSTGSPKACVHPARNPIASFERYARGVLDIAADDVVLAVPKLFFGYARDLVAMFGFAVGGTGIVFAERTTPERIFALIHRHRPTILVNVPTMMNAMLAHPAPAELTSLRLCTSAGEALPVEVHRAWDRAFGVPVVDGIGSSEAYHIYLSNRPGATRHGTLGKPVPGYTARIVADDGTEVAGDEIGVLEVTGPTVATEYWQAPEKTAATFRGNTVHTGDLFSRDADGYYVHHGRADDLLKVGGIFVAPSEIEHCLVGHPDVADSAVHGYTDNGLVRPRAFVVLRDGAATGAADLTEFARRQLAGQKYPREIRFVAELPRTANGKLDRRALRERYG